MEKQTINEAFELGAEKRKKNRTRIKKIISLIKFISITALFFAAVIFTLLSPLFDLKEIEVYGAEHYSKEAITEYAGIKMDENGFRQIGSSPVNIIMLRFGSSEAMIKKNCPYVKEIAARFSIPSKVVINVTERQAAAAVPYLGTSLLIDSNGYVLETKAPDKKLELPLIKGLEFNDYKLGSKLEIKNRGALDDSIKLLEALKENSKIDKTNIFSIVNIVDAGDRSLIKITLDSRIIVKLGNLDNLNYKISATNTIFYKNIKKGEKGVLDFTAGENPVFSPE